MKFTRVPIIVEAFQAGVDEVPDWFMDRVSSGEIILKPEPLEGPWCTMIRWNDAETKVKKGDYITNSLFPFTTYDPEHFESAYLMGDLAIVYTLGFEVNQAIEAIGLGFENKEEVYNSLHEDLRDLRRSVLADNKDISELLLQIAVTALKARRDLYE